jgi:hypothetical protein
MGAGSSNNSPNLTSFNNTNTLSKYEPPIFDNKIDRKFDDYEIKFDISRDDASPQNTLII